MQSMKIKMKKWRGESDEKGLKEDGWGGVYHKKIFNTPKTLNLGRSEKKNDEKSSNSS